MMGEIEEPSGLEFQANSLNSGSISFGRFESESLCWERRSSFSHNRYLEEVEKYSKPGSVTEKKAYFEAHFKKKGILSLLSPGTQIKTGFHQNAENEGDDDQIDGDENSLSNDESCNSTLTNEKEQDVSGYRVEEAFETKIEHSCDDSDCNKNNNIEIGKSDEEDQARDGDSFSAGSLKENQITEILEDETSGLRCHLPDSQSTEGSSYNEYPKDQREKSIKEKASSLGDECTARPRSSSRRNTSGELSKISEKKPNKTVDNARSKAAKKDLQVSESTKYSKQKAISANAINVIKRVEKQSRNGVVKPQSSVPKEISGKVHQIGKRVIPVSILSHPKQETSKIANSNSTEHAHRRKKFEEQMQAKQGKMQQFQAQTEEKKEAETRQLRKGLNFQARPLPSFYRRASRESDKSKDIPGNVKLQRQRSNKSSSNGITTSSQNSRLKSGQGTPIHHNPTKDLNP